MIKVVEDTGGQETRITSKAKNATRTEPRITLAIPKQYVVIESKRDDVILLDLPTGFAGPLARLITERVAAGEEMVLRKLDKLYAKAE